MSREVAGADGDEASYRPANRDALLPLRWLAPETLHDGSVSRP